MVRAINRSQVRLIAAILPDSDSGQVVHIHIPSTAEVTTLWHYRNLINLFFNVIFNEQSLFIYLFIYCTELLAMGLGYIL